MWVAPPPKCNTLEIRLWLKVCVIGAARGGGGAHYPARVAELLFTLAGLSTAALFGMFYLWWFQNLVKVNAR